jgi:hypothetical protein
MKVVICVYFMWLCRHVKEFIPTGLASGMVTYFNPLPLNVFCFHSKCQYSFCCICESSVQCALDQYISIINSPVGGSIEQVHSIDRADSALNLLLRFLSVGAY